MRLSDCIPNTSLNCFNKVPTECLIPFTEWSLKWGGGGATKREGEGQVKVYLYEKWGRGADMQHRKNYILMMNVVGEPKPKFGKLQGWGATEGLKADPYVKQPAGSESGFHLCP